MDEDLEYYEEYDDEELEYYEEYDDEDYYDDGFTVSDSVFIFVAVGLFLGIVAAIFAMIRKTFKKANVKIGKLEVGVETVQKEKAEKKEEETK